MALYSGTSGQHCFIVYVFKLLALLIMFLPLHFNYVNNIDLAYYANKDKSYINNKIIVSYDYYHMTNINWIMTTLIASNSFMVHNIVYGMIQTICLA